MKLVFDLRVKFTCSSCKYLKTYKELETFQGKLVFRHYCRSQMQHINKQPDHCVYYDKEYVHLCT